MKTSSPLCKIIMRHVLLPPRNVTFLKTSDSPQCCIYSDLRSLRIRNSCSHWGWGYHESIFMTWLPKKLRRKCDSLNNNQKSFCKGLIITDLKNNLYTDLKGLGSSISICRKLSICDVKSVICSIIIVIWRKGTRVKYYVCMSRVMLIFILKSSNDDKCW